MKTKLVRVIRGAWRGGLVAAGGLALGCGSSAADPAGPGDGSGDETSTSSAASGGIGGQSGEGIELVGSGGAGASDSGCGPVTSVCQTDEECSDGNPCTDDVCVPEGEFLACTSTPIADCQGDPTAPIDSSCDDAQGGDPVNDAVWIPFVPLETPSLPDSCNDGFEWQNCKGTYTATPEDACGAEAQTLYVDIATYTIGDRLRISAVGADDQPYLLLDTCRIRTYETPDPTGGKTRPPDESIRQFTIVVQPGTKSVTFDSTQTTSPWYMRVLGLCGFAPLTSMDTCAWRPASL